MKKNVLMNYFFKSNLALAIMAHLDEVLSHGLKGHRFGACAGGWSLVSVFHINAPLSLSLSLQK